MAIPPIAPLPQAPSRSDGPVAFNALADPFIAALPPFVLQANALGAAINEALISMGQGVSAAAGSATAAAASATAANASKVAAAQSAIDATNNGAAQVALAAAQAALATTNGAAQVALAATQANLATTNGAAQVALAAAQVTLAAGLKTDTAGLRDQAQIIADAARAAVGIPSYLLKPGYVFEVNDDATGIQWGTRHKIGEAILTARDMDASYLPLAGGTYLQSAYPLLFAEVGLTGAVSGDVWSQVMAPTTIPAFKTVKRGKDGVLIAQPYFLATSSYYRSTDNGATWALLSFASVAGNSTTTVNFIGTDEKGVWIIGGRSSGGMDSLCRSVDNGLTWVSVRNLAVTDGMNSVACETDTNGTWIMTGGSSSLYTVRSLDNGLTWARVQQAVGSRAGTSISCDRLGTWILAVLSGAYRSTDNGTTWTSINLGNSSIVNAISNNGKGVWVAVSSGTEPASRSPDNGLTWASIGVGIINETLNSIATDNAGNWFIGTSSGRIIRSVSDGQSWTVLPAFTTGFLATDTIMAVLMINADVLGFVYQSGSGNYTKVRRSNGTYPYDSATMFKLPDLRAPQGLNYLIKAKEAA